MNGNEPKAKKTLINALENLESKAYTLMDLADFSDSVVGKLNNPRPDPTPIEDCSGKTMCEERELLDLIDLFNNVADKIQSATQRIGANTEELKFIIG